MEITREEFRAYEEVRNGGATNMWDANMVAYLSGGLITSDKALEVIKRYNQLHETYPDVKCGACEAN